MLIGCLLLTCMFEAWMCYWFVATMVNKKIKYTIPRVILIVSGILVVGVLSALGGNIMFSLDDIWLAMMIVAICWMLLVFRTCIIQVIELVVIYFSAFAILDFFFSFVFLFRMDSYFTQIVTSGWSGWNIAVYWIARVTMFFVILALKWLLPKDFVVKDCKLVFGLTGAGLLILAAFYQSVFMMSLDQVYGEGKEVQFRLIAVSALAILAIVYGVFILFLKTKTAQRESDVFKIQSEMQKKQFHEVQQITEKNQRMVHDVRNHYLVLQELAKNKDLDGVDQYLQEITNSDLMTERSKWTGCRILDLILNQKKQEAERQQIDFQIESTGTVRFNLREDEMVSLFGNLLDNAIEACQKIEEGERLIRTKIERKNDIVYISVSNTVAEPPIVLDGIPVSTKEEKEIHGYGFKNIKSIVDNNGGTIVIDSDGAVFEVRIMLFDNRGSVLNEEKSDCCDCDNSNIGVAGNSGTKLQRGFWNFFHRTTSVRNVEGGTMKKWIPLIVILVVVTIVILWFGSGVNSGHAISIWFKPE